MLNKDLSKLFTHSTLGLALLTTITICLPSVSLAQQQPARARTSIVRDYLLGGAIASVSMYLKFQNTPENIKFLLVVQLICP